MIVLIPSVGSNTRAMHCPCIMGLVHNRLAQSRFNLDWICFWSRLKGVLQSALYTLLVGLQLYWLVYLSPFFCAVTGVVLLWTVCGCVRVCVLCVCLREWLNFVNVQQFLLSFHLHALQVISCGIYAHVSIVVVSRPRFPESSIS